MHLSHVESRDTNLTNNSKVSAVPTFLLFKNGVKSGEVVGATYEKVKALVLSAH